MPVSIQRFEGFGNHVFRAEAPRSHGEAERGERPVVPDQLRTSKESVNLVKTSTHSPKPETRNPKPETPNPNSLDPKSHRLKERKYLLKVCRWTVNLGRPEMARNDGSTGPKRHRKNQSTWLGFRVLGSGLGFRVQVESLGPRILVSGSWLRVQGLNVGGWGLEFFSQQVFSTSFLKRQFPHKFINVFSL